MLGRVHSRSELWWDVFEMLQQSHNNLAQSYRCCQIRVGLLTYKLKWQKCESCGKVHKGYFA